MTWLNYFDYRKQISVDARGDGALTNYQLKLTIHSGNGSDSTGIIYLNNSSANWPYDIRFADDTATELDYFFESSQNDEVLEAWIELDVSNTVVNDYYIYFGSSSLDTTTSSGQRTFRWYYDWEDGTASGNWTRIERTDGTYDSDYGTFISTQTADCDFPLRALARFKATWMSSQSGDTPGVCLGFGGISGQWKDGRLFQFKIYNRYAADWNARDWALPVRWAIQSSQIYLGTGGPSGGYEIAHFTKDNWYIMEMYSDRDACYTSGHIYSGSNRNVVVEAGMVSSAKVSATGNAAYFCYEETTADGQVNTAWSGLGWNSTLNTMPVGAYDTDYCGSTVIDSKWLAMAAFAHPEPTWDTTDWGTFEESGAAGEPAVSAPTNIYGTGEILIYGTGVIELT